MSRADNLASLLNSSGLIDSDDISVGAISAAKLADGSVDSDVLGTGAVTDNKYGGTISVDGSGNITVGGSVTDDVSDVRTPRRLAISTTGQTISNEGVYYLTPPASSNIILGAPASGTVMTLYNNTGNTISLEDGNTVTHLRLAADNNTTHNNTLTLGAYSTTTITMFSGIHALVTGTDVSAP